MICKLTMLLTLCSFTGVWGGAGGNLIEERSNSQLSGSQISSGLPSRLAQVASELNTKLYNSAVATQELMKRIEDIQQKNSPSTKEHTGTNTLENVPNLYGANAVDNFKIFERGRSELPGNDVPGFLNSLVTRGRVPNAGLEALFAVLNNLPETAAKRTKNPEQRESESNTKPSEPRAKVALQSLLDRLTGTQSLPNRTPSSADRDVLRGNSIRLPNSNLQKETIEEIQLGLPSGALSHSLGHPLIVAPLTEASASEPEVHGTLSSIKPLPQVSLNRGINEPSSGTLDSSEDDKADKTERIEQERLPMPSLSLPLELPLSGDSTHCFLNTIEFVGEALSIINDVKEPATCQNYCLKSSKCAFYTLNLETKRCNLFEQILSVRHSNKVVSGPKLCSEPERGRRLGDATAPTGIVFRASDITSPADLWYKNAATAFTEGATGITDSLIAKITNKMFYNNDDQDLSRSLLAAGMEGEKCMAENTGFRGESFQLDENVHSPADCQQLCEKTADCKFFSHAVQTGRCFLYSSVYSVKESGGVVSGTKYCHHAVSQGARQNDGTQHATGHHFSNTDLKEEHDAPHVKKPNNLGRLMGPDDIMSLLYGTNSDNHHQKNIALSQTNGDVTGYTNENNESYLKGEMNSYDPFASPQSNSYQSLGSSSSGLLDGLISGDNKFLGGLLNGRHGGLLGSLLPTGEATLGPQKTNDGLEGFGLQTINMVKTLGAMMAAGNTVMKTLPIAEMIQTGYQLSNSGFFDKSGGAKGGVSPNARSKSEAAAPPVGVASPEVTCLSEGMKCCVPRNAAPRYQVKPPKLNGVDTPRCRATYVSQTDQLCVTTRYTDEECQTFVMETSTMFVYRNIMDMPSKTMNNAVCECTVSKPVGNATGDNREATNNTAINGTDNATLALQDIVPHISGSAKWQYSLAAKEEEEEARAKSYKAIDRLDSGAKAMKLFTTTFLKNLKQEGGHADNEAVSHAANFFDDISSFNNELKRYESPPTTRTATATVPSNLGTLRNLLAGDDHISDELPPQTANNLVKQETEFSHQLRATVAPHTYIYAFPLHCSMWPKKCAKNFEQIFFNGDVCKPLRFIQNGCSQENFVVDIDWSKTDMDFREGPLYRIEVPTDFNVQPIGIGCEFIFTQRSNMSEITRMCSNSNITASSFGNTFLEGLLNTITALAERPDLIKQVVDTGSVIGNEIGSRIVEDIKKMNPIFDVSPTIHNHQKSFKDTDMSDNHGMLKSQSSPDMTSDKQDQLLSGQGLPLSFGHWSTNNIESVPVNLQQWPAYKAKQHHHRVSNSIDHSQNHYLTDIQRRRLEENKNIQPLLLKRQTPTTTIEFTLGSLGVQEYNHSSPSNKFPALFDVQQWIDTTSGITGLGYLSSQHHQSNEETIIF